MIVKPTFQYSEHIVITRMMGPRAEIGLITWNILHGETVQCCFDKAKIALNRMLSLWRANEIYYNPALHKITFSYDTISAVGRVPLYSFIRKTYPWIDQEHFQFEPHYLADIDFISHMMLVLLPR